MRYIALRTADSSVMMDTVLTELEEAVDCADIREAERGLIVAGWSLDITTIEPMAARCAGRKGIVRATSK